MGLERVWVLGRVVLELEGLGSEDETGVRGHLSDHLGREDDREEGGPDEGGRHHENENENEHVRGWGDHDRGCGRAQHHGHGRDCAHDHSHGNESGSGSENESESVCEGRIRGHVNVVEGVRSAELPQGNTPNSLVFGAFGEWAEKQWELLELMGAVVGE